MVDMGAEVGHKMRSAIKAKLTELDCYVDDELPDYIMVMVANKRTKTQMNEDLNLFLNTKTSTFVDWLHIVLKKLKEVTVTNLEVYKKAEKRKSSDVPSSTKVKKEKRIKKEKNTINYDNEKSVKQEKEVINKSLTDDLPFNVKTISGSRKIQVVSNVSPEDEISQKSDKIFDIPSICEVDKSNYNKLQEIENQIKNVKSRLGLKVEDDVEEAELRRIVENSRNKSKEQLTDTPSNFEEKLLSNGRHIELDTSKNIQLLPNKEYSVEKKTENVGACGKNNIYDQACSMKKEHSRIIFSKNDFQDTPCSLPKRKSVLERLGKFGDNQEKSSLPRVSKNTEITKWKNSNEFGNDKEDVHDKILSTEFERDERNLAYNHYEGNNERQYLQGKGDGSFNSRSHNFKKEHFSKRVTDKFKIMDSSSKKNDDLRQYLLKNNPPESLRKDLKKRLGLSSKITVPQIDPQLLEDTFKKREVVSVVKVKPRILPPNIQQANKNLLLKAVADAQKSVAQSKPVGENLKNNTTELYNKNESQECPTDALYTKRYKLNSKEDHQIKKISLKGKEKLKCLLSSHGSVGRLFLEHKKGDQEYIPEPIKHNLSNVEYIPSILTSQKNEVSPNYIEKKTQQKFIVTLDSLKKDAIAKISVKDRLHGRKTPSPIIFESNNSISRQLKESPKVDESMVSDNLKEIPPSLTKVREKCKYFPQCRNGENCEFYHPSRNCEQFPYCKFGEKCLYLHPSCKFGTSCTRRGCPYSHSNYLKQGMRK
ncbi:hypothetical protein WA026_006339 [Henosepilachna vigintioctopunctata]|uniref:Zinc finger CCCH domain-containing protein 14 n=1 Tax=Henosepilachna vigintioctopunctata TaxID=420089 RepID=A0AAW1TNM1_9CUCU